MSQTPLPQMTPAKPKPPPIPTKPNQPRPAASSAISSAKKFGVKAGRQTEFQKVMIYGPGGIGKTELCANLTQLGLKPLFLDVGSSTNFMDVPRVEPSPTTWDEMRDALHDQDLWRGHDVVVVDDLTTSESLAIQWTLANVKKEKQGGESTFVNSIEGYGWGKGYVHTFETFLQLLGDLDAHIRAGRMVVTVAHSCISKVPSPEGEWIRYEPRLQNSDKGNIRARLIEWTDHTLFLSYDVFVKDGRAQGAATRTCYPIEMPTHLAKSRELSDPIPYERGSADIWRALLKK